MIVHFDDDDIYGPSYIATCQQEGKSYPSYPHISQQQFRCALMPLNVKALEALELAFLTLATFARVLGESLLRCLGIVCGSSV